MNTRVWRSWLGLGLLLVLGLSGCERHHFYTSVPSGAMAPTIKPGTMVTVDFKAYKHGGAIKRWDIVAIKSKRTIVVKRVVGLAGEAIKLSEDGKTLWVDGKAVAVPKSIPWRGKKLVSRATAEYPIVGHEVDVPPGEVYVLGDNLAVSVDSREVGPVAVSKITGRVELGKKKAAGP